MAERFPHVLATLDPSVIVSATSDFFSNPAYAPIRGLIGESLRDLGGFLITVVAARYGAPRVLRDLLRLWSPRRFEATLRAQDERLADLEEHCDDQEREIARLHGELDAARAHDAPPDAKGDAKEA